MKIKTKILWIARTSICIALLIVMQAATAPLGNTLVTGSINNLLMIVTVMILGIAPGLTVAAVSPVLAKFLGIGPLWGLIPFIMAGNAALILLWHFIGNRKTRRRIAAYIMALLCAAVIKFLVLYLGIVQIAVPLLLGLPEPQAAVISNMFSIPQLITAITGGALATAILPPLKKASGKRWE